MPIPLQVSPSPIVNSNLELRIKSALNTHQIFSELFNRLKDLVPKVSTNQVPNEFPLILTEQIKYLPTYILSNDDFSISISDKVVSLSNVDEYKLWGPYFTFIKSALTEVFSMGYITMIERIGLRYGSVFPNISNIEEVINFKPALPIPGYNEVFNHYRGDYKIDTYNIHVQIFNKARVQRKSKVFAGAVIDIDASYNTPIPPDQDVFRIINDLHTHEKIMLFEKLLRQEFVDTLNPIYGSAPN